MKVSSTQCCGSGPISTGSESADPVLNTQDPDPGDEKDQIRIRNTDVRFLFNKILLFILVPFLPDPDSQHWFLD